MTGVSSSRKALAMCNLLLRPLQTPGSPRENREIGWLEHSSLNRLELSNKHITISWFYLDLLGWKKKFWKNEYANDLWVHGYFSASRRWILMQFSTICSLVFSYQVSKNFWKLDVIKYCWVLKTFWKSCDIIWTLCSNTHADRMLYGKWFKRYRGTTHEKDVQKT